MRTTLVTFIAIASSVSIGAYAADREAKAIDRIDAAADTVHEMMNAPDKGVPKDLLDKARCVVVVPGMKKAGFIVGAKYGKGYAVCRKASGSGWSAPAAYILEGGSVGFQIGASEQDVILLVMNEGGMKHLLSDKFTLGGEATAAAGPVGRDAEAQTDVAMRAEILSYSRSRGLFAGISLQGASLRPDHETDHELYGHDVTTHDVLSGPVKAPVGAHKLDMALNGESKMRG
jgi:lipid-binding SYLF domain-containing protein